MLLGLGGLGILQSVSAQEPAAAETQPTTAPATTSPATAPADADDVTSHVITLTGEADAAARRAAAQAILASGSKSGIQALADILGRRNNHEAKLAICAALRESRLQNSALVQPLIGLLQNEDTQLVEAAMSALARFEDAAAQTAVKQYQERLRDEALRERSKRLYALLADDAQRLAQSIAWLQSPLTMDRLIALEIIHEDMLGTPPRPPAPDVHDKLRKMLYDPDRAVRKKLVAVLRDLRDSADAEVIAGMTQQEASSEVLEEIFKALGRMGNAGVISACIEGLEHPKPNVAAAAAGALGRLCRQNGSGGQPENTSVAVEALLARANEPLNDPRLREEITDALAEIADPRALPLLLSTAQETEAKPETRLAAIRGIGRIGSRTPETMKPLAEQLANSGDPRVQEAAAEAIGALGSKPEDLEPLRNRLDAKAPAVQAKAWEAYRKIFSRLSPDAALAVVDTWPIDNATGAKRRVTLLGDLRDRLTAGNPDSPKLVEATRRLVDAHLQAGATDAAISLAASTQRTEVRAAAAAELAEHAESLSSSDGSAALAMIDSVHAAVPDLFGSPWQERFNAAKQSATATTQPAATQPAVEAEAPADTQTSS